MMIDIEEYTEQWRNRESALERTGRLNQWGFDVLTALIAKTNECESLREELARAKIWHDEVCAQLTAAEVNVRALRSLRGPNPRSSTK